MGNSSGGNPEKRVFVSYSREPAENLAFVRELAGYLRSARFAVWVDEEQISGAKDIEEEIKAGIMGSDAGLFVVTKRWLQRERDFIRHEVKLVGRSNARRLVLLREPVDDTDLGPEFATLKRLEWFPNDPQPFARLWEIYCGITGEKPGPWREWEAKGKQVFGVGTQPIPPPLAAGKWELECSGRPIASLDAGDWIYLVTERGEWVGIRPDGETHPPIPHCSEYGAAGLNQSNELLLAGYDSSIARLRGQRWEILQQESPVLCFATGPSGCFAGTAAGAVVSVDGQPCKPILRMRDPVAAMTPYEGGMLVLGTRGMFGRVAWPVMPRDELRWVSTAELGRPLGFFPTLELNHVGLFSLSRTGVLDPETERIVVCPKSLDEGIRSVTFVGPQVWPYLVLTDAGNLLMMDASLRNTRPVRFARGVTLVGCTGTGGRGASLVWTNDGRLYHVSAQGLSEELAERDVVLAYSPQGTDGAHVVRWSPGQRPTVEQLRLQ